MQTEGGLRAVLSSPLVYRLFQRAAGAVRSRRWLIDEMYRVHDGTRMVDIGCGPGDILDELPPLTYIGLDISPEYIAAARQRYGARGTFVVGEAPRLLQVPEAFGADLVACAGVLHHVSDAQMLELLDVSYQLLAAGGRFVAWEPTYLLHQSRVSRWLLGKDRGMAVRTEQRWKELMAQSRFEDVRTSIATHLLRIPYTHIIIEACRR